MKLKHVLLIDDNPSIQVSSPERDDTMPAYFLSFLNCDLVHRPLRETMLEKGTKFIVRIPNLLAAIN